MAGERSFKSAVALRDSKLAKASGIDAAMAIEHVHKSNLTLGLSSSRCTISLERLPL